MTLNTRNILVDGRSLLDPGAGGVYEYGRALIAALKDRGDHRYRVWSNQRMNAAPEVLMHADVMTRWPNKLLHAGIRFAEAPRIDALAGGTADIFWAPNPHFVAVSPDLPVVVTVHDLSFERYPEFFSAKRRLWHDAVDPKALCRRATAVLAVSAHTKRDLVELYGLPPDKITVTHEGCDPNLFRTTDTQASELKRRLDLPERFILHVGAIEPRKNHLGLLAAFERLKKDPRHADLGLVLAGPRGWKNRVVLDAVRRSLCAEDIRLLGFVPAGDKPALYRAAEVFAFPSFYEGFGLPPLEAMAAGVPIVASFASSIGEIVGDAGLLIDPYRPADIADALGAVLESPALRTRLTERGTARARRFTWESCAATTAAVFQDLT